VKLWQSLSSILLVFILASGLIFGAACNREKGEATRNNTLARQSAQKAISQTNAPSRPTNRLEWNIQTTVAAYEASHYANPAWNRSALAAFSAFASLRSGMTATNGNWEEIIASNCDLAVKAGCQDPLIGYLQARSLVNRELDKAALAEKLIGAATKLQRSTYPTIHKFHATVDALGAGTGVFTSTVYQQKTKDLTDPKAYLSEILNDPDISVEEAYAVCDRTLEAGDDIPDAKRYETTYRMLEEPMFRRWPDDYRTWLLKGEAYIKMAWILRGGGYRDTVTTEGYKGFSDSLTEAQKALEKGWSLNQTNTEIPIKMMTVALGGCGGKLVT